MRLDEYVHLRIFPVPEGPPRVGVADLSDKSDRTLLFGYDAAHNAWHLYLHAELFWVVVYKAREEPATLLRAEEPDDVVAVSEVGWAKRLYPESCDAEFCHLLLRRGVTLPFLQYKDMPARRRAQWEATGFHGATHRAFLNQGAEDNEGAEAAARKTNKDVRR